MGTIKNGKDLRWVRERLGRIDTLLNVKITLGPKKGKNVILDKKFGPPQVCSEGKIAKKIDLEDPFENMGAPF
ncbi:MAG: hypothetical protein CM15mP129_07360 [Chloroflexota bacterium]|nr:MAG: hypothetical protein CM15mP129_07360 [Chloroflexota bacterium]